MNDEKDQRRLQFCCFVFIYLFSYFMFFTRFFFNVFRKTNGCGKRFYDRELPLLTWRTLSIIYIKSLININFIQMGMYDFLLYSSKYNLVEYREHTSLNENSLNNFSCVIKFEILYRILLLECLQKL